MLHPLPTESVDVFLGDPGPLIEGSGIFYPGTICATFRSNAGRILSQGGCNWSWTAETPFLKFKARTRVDRWLHGGFYGRRVNRRSASRRSWEVKFHDERPTSIHSRNLDGPYRLKPNYHVGRILGKPQKKDSQPILEKSPVMTQFPQVDLTAIGVAASSSGTFTAAAIHPIRVSTGNHRHKPPQSVSS